MVLSFSRLLISGTLILLVSAKNAVSMSESKTVENKPADFRSEVTSPHCLCETGNASYHRYTCRDNKNNTVDLLIHHRLGEDIRILVCCRSCLKTIRNPNIKLKYSGRQPKQEIEYSPTFLESCSAPEIIIKEIYTNVEWFKGTTWFYILRCSNDVAISLPENLFRPVSNLRLISLTGNDSYVREIPMNFFDQSPELQHLRVTKAGLTQLEDDTFKHLAALEELYLNSNRLSNLRRELFTPLRSLTRLDLSSNNIPTLLKDIFLDLKYLTDLRLNKNMLTHLPENIFREQTLLKLIDLNDNRLKELPGTLFHASPHLQSVYLQRNHLTELNETLFSNLRRLQELYLGANKLITLNEKVFSNLQDLRSLGLDGNKLTTLDETLFMNLQKLRDISLQGNNLRIKNWKLFQNMRDVVKLSFSGNIIQSIDGFKVPRKLKELKLDHNKISALETGSIKMLNKSGMILTLAGNPWKCECDTIEDLLDFLQHTSSKIEDKRRILCDGSGSRVTEVSKFEVCYKHFFIITAFLAVFGVLFGSSFVLYHKYEYEIKVFMFARKICLCLISEKEIDRDKVYDAFISYCHQDEDFVAKKLVPSLENEPYSYKLCLHYRDWMPGESVADQVVKSVESSRRTIIVLSRDYLKSRWGIMEFMTAYVKGLEEGVPRVIIVLLEELDTSEDDLSPELKAHISTRTYLKVDDSWFWDKLRYVLPHHQPKDISRKRTMDGLMRE